MPALFLPILTLHMNDTPISAGYCQMLDSTAEGHTSWIDAGECVISFPGNYNHFVVVVAADDASFDCSNSAICARDQVQADPAGDSCKSVSLPSCMPIKLKCSILQPIQSTVESCILHEKDLDNMLYLKKGSRGPQASPRRASALARAPCDGEGCPAYNSDCPHGLLGIWKGRDRAATICSNAHLQP